MSDVWKQCQALKQQYHYTSLVPSLYKIKDISKKKYITTEIFKILKTRPQSNIMNLPVSLSRENLHDIAKNPLSYIATLKSDGIRYLLVLFRYKQGSTYNNMAVMCSRNLKEMYEIRLVAHPEYFQGTILDGELVWEKHKIFINNSRQKFMIFDALAIAGKSILNQSFINRYKTMSVLIQIQQDMVDSPHNWEDVSIEIAKQQNKIVCNGNVYCLQFAVKPIYALHTMNAIWDSSHSLNSSSHSSNSSPQDGFVFYNIDDAYQMGTQYTLYKWKPKHTIDVTWVYNEQDEIPHKIQFLDQGNICWGHQHGISFQRPACLESHRDLYPYSSLAFIMEVNDYMNILIKHFKNNNITQFQLIVECTCKLPNMNEITEWIISKSYIPMIRCKIIRVRKDKNAPNQKNTIEKTIYNIMENITQYEMMQLFV